MRAQPGVRRYRKPVGRRLGEGPIDISMRAWRAEKHTSFHLIF